MTFMHRAFCRLLLCLSLVLAMATSGFAHRGVESGPAPELAAYLAAGGSLADLCGDVGGGHEGVQSCAACRLIEAAFMPFEAVGVPLRLSAGTQAHVLVAKRLQRSRGLDPARLTRAPPAA